ncbi:hypothetical protein BCR34DRAFT_28542 [Clohesyomyces aquaticus]|uniref:C2H2-type domain-containing protein n=1 Tax=Clohesyomyces aquaticus TaxID=1231657 RepID=A0A1Y1ZAL9_9PLEO|nr:hypothetical protein BCR34DRAFT_28542 [Clohesyomyces aquaticus]
MPCTVEQYDLGFDVWFCCQCLDGPMDWRINAACNCCDHGRCAKVGTEINTSSPPTGHPFDLAESNPQWRKTAHSTLLGQAASFASRGKKSPVREALDHSTSHQSKSQSKGLARFDHGFSPKCVSPQSDTSDLSTEDSPSDTSSIWDGEREMGGDSDCFSPTGAPSSITGQSLDTSINCVVACLLEDLLRATNQCGQEDTKDTKDGDADSRNQTSGSSSRDQISYSKKRVRHDGDLRRTNNSDDQDQDENDRRKQRKSVKHNADTPSSRRRRLACPYFKRNPHKYRCHSESCRGPGWPDFSHVREHLKKHHHFIECDRCFEVFVSEDKLSAHRSELPWCRGLDARDHPPPEGINFRMLASLKGRKGPASRSQEDLWRESYPLLFGNAVKIPSPYYEDDDHEHANAQENRDSYRRELVNDLKTHLPRELWEQRLHSYIRSMLESEKEAIEDLYRQTYFTDDIQPTLEKLLSSWKPKRGMRNTQDPVRRATEPSHQPPLLVLPTAPEVTDYPAPTVLGALPPELREDELLELAGNTKELPTYFTAEKNERERPVGRSTGFVNEMDLPIMRGACDELAAWHPQLHDPMEKAEKQVTHLGRTIRITDVSETFHAAARDSEQLEEEFSNGPANSTFCSSNLGFEVPQPSAANHQLYDFLELGSMYDLNGFGSR